MDKTIYPIEDFQQALLDVDRIKATDIIEAVFQHHNTLESLEYLVTLSLKNIGDRWERGETSLSQVYMSGIICGELMEKYMPKNPVLKESQRKIGIGVLQDHHGLGKRIVFSILQAGGYPVIDLGQGLTVQDLVEKTLKEEIEILLISTLMLPSALRVKDVVKKLRAQGSKVKVIVGGAPFRLDPELWKKVGADADGKNGTRAKELLDCLGKELDQGELHAACPDHHKS